MLNSSILLLNVFCRLMPGYEYSLCRRKHNFVYQCQSDPNFDRIWLILQLQESTKSRRKAKSSKQSKKRDKLPKGDTSSSLVPFVDVALAVNTVFSDFRDDSRSPEETKGKKLQWEDDDDLAADLALPSRGYELTTK